VSTHERPRRRHSPVHVPLRPQRDPPQPTGGSHRGAAVSAYSGGGCIGPAGLSPCDRGVQHQPIHRFTYTEPVKRGPHGVPGAGASTSWCC
jgi:hypothetical protein